MRVAFETEDTSQKALDCEVNERLWLLALQRHARGSSSSGGGSGGGGCQLCTLRTVERGPAPLPDFNPADTLAAIAHFGGIPDDYCGGGGDGGGGGGGDGGGGGGGGGKGGLSRDTLVQFTHVCVCITQQCINFTCLK